MRIALGAFGVSTTLVEARRPDGIIANSHGGLRPAASRGFVERTIDVFDDVIHERLDA